MTILVAEVENWTDVGTGENSEAWAQALAWAESHPSLVAFLSCSYWPSESVFTMDTARESKNFRMTVEWMWLFHFCSFQWAIHSRRRHRSPITRCTFVELVAGLIVKSRLLKAFNSLAGHWSNSMLPKLELQISKIISQWASNELAMSQILQIRLTAKIEHCGSQGKKTSNYF